jgi:2-polyprenyl-6-methoxyphenol hydroxylase-like FAD-dependent oxidoreductase
MKFVSVSSILCNVFFAPTAKALMPQANKAMASIPVRSSISRFTAASVMEQETVQMPETRQMTDTIVCGAGPAGLLTAIMLAQKFPDKKVSVYDRLGAPPSPTDDAVWSDVAKFYLIGLGARGQRALAEFGVWDAVERVCTSVVGRRDWSPESEDAVERIFTDRPVTTQVLPRDKLVGVLYEHILEKYADKIELNFGYEVTPIDFAAGDGTEVMVMVSKCQSTTRVNPSSTEPSDKAEVVCDVDDSIVMSTNLLIAADGTSRTVANSMETMDKKKFESMNPVSRLFAGKPFRVTRYEDDNQRIYKTVPFKLPEGWRPDLNYSARSKGNRVVFDALPANRFGDYCGVMLLKGGDPLTQPDTDPKELRALFNENLPQFSILLDDSTIEAVAKKGPSFLPSFRYVGPRLHQEDRTVILGDCAHTVKPYFGLGANSALEDVKFLSEAITATNGDLTAAVHKFSRERAGEAKALVRISRELDRPGKVGFVTFVLPLILDSVFHKLAPKVFAPNVISMLQKEGYGFRRVARRKRTDRMLQIALLASGLTVLTAAVRTVVGVIARAFGRRSSTVVGGGVALLAAFVLAKKLAGYLVPGMAPADILAKTKSKVTGSPETMQSMEQGKETPVVELL